MYISYFLCDRVVKLLTRDDVSSTPFCCVCHYGCVYAVGNGGCGSRHIGQCLCCGSISLTKELRIRSFYNILIKFQIQQFNFMTLVNRRAIDVRTLFSRCFCCTSKYILPL